MANDEGSGEAFGAFQKRVEGTNINPQTLLATDYLNHFNEIVMILEMVPDIPDIMEEAKAWQAKTYPEHTRDSTFSDRDLAIEAYDHVPARYREPFEQTIGQMERLVASTIERMEQEIASHNAEVLRLTADVVTRLLYQLIGTAAAIIHGIESVMDQAEIDQLLG